MLKSVPQEVPIYIGLGEDNDEVVIKSDKKDENIIYIEASNELEDQDGEVVLQKALEEQAEAYLKAGVLSWDHLHKIEKKNEYIIGEPLDVQFTRDGIKNRTLVKGKLYHLNDHAIALKKNLKSGSTRYGASIGGNIVAKSKRFAELAKKSCPTISKLLWDETAITHKPVNRETKGGVTYTKYKEFGKSFQLVNDQMFKALMAGSGVNPATFGSGRTLIPEVTKTKSFWVDIFGAINKGTIGNYKSLSKYLKDNYKFASEDSVSFVAEYIMERAGLL